MCEHDYKYLYSEYEKTEGPGLNNYKQVDVFYCTKCLQYKKIIAREVNERHKPSWFKG